MAIERWGSLSVADHTNDVALVANVLLYDRLVMPVLPKWSRDEEKARWVAAGWDPDLQARRADDLEELVIRRPWDKSREEIYKSRMEEIAAERLDAQYVDSLQMTRRILAQEQVLEKFPGVNHVEVIPAYNSTNIAQHYYGLQTTVDPRTAQATLITRRLAVPDRANPDEALRIAKELSRDPDFRAKRWQLFEWQDRMVSRGLPAEAVVEELAELTDGYNAAVLAASKKVLWRYAFTVASAAVGFAGGGVAFAAASAALSLLQFAVLDAAPTVDGGRSAPAAMFHDIEIHLGIRVRRAG